MSHLQGKHLQSLSSYYLGTNAQTRESAIDSITDGEPSSHCQLAAQQKEGAHGADLQKIHLSKRNRLHKPA